MPTRSLKLRESKAKGGGLVVEGVSGNAAKSGIKPGDTIIYASSWFGDELWPTDKLSFTQTAIQRAPSPVAFVYVSVSTHMCVVHDSSSSSSSSVWGVYLYEM